MTRGIGRIVQRLFIGYHIGIVRMAGKVQGQSRPFVLRKFRQIAVWQILPTCIFTDIVGIIEANYKKEGPGVFPFKKGNGSLSQSVVGVRMKDRKTKLPIRYGSGMYMPLSGICAFISGMLHQNSQGRCPQGIGHRHIVSRKTYFMGCVSRKHGCPRRTAQGSRAISIGKQDTRLRQTVYIRGMHIRISHTAHSRSRLLIGHNIDNIRQLLGSRQNWNKSCGTK